MSKKTPKKMVLVKDIIIPAGTILTDVSGTSRRMGNDVYEKTIGLTNNTFGYFTYFMDDDENLKEYIREVNE